MEVHVEPEGAVSSLHSRDGAGMGVGNAWEVEKGFGSFAERTVELVREGTHNLRREDAVIAEQRAQAPGQGANPVTHGYAGQHLLLRVDSGVGHASPQAGGAKAAALAGESYELRVAAATANEVQAARGQEPAAQILLELAHHELRKATMLGEVFQHLGPMGLDGLVEHALFGPSARVAVPANGRV